jgi:hypothetical protein
MQFTPASSISVVAFLVVVAAVLAATLAGSYAAVLRGNGNADAARRTTGKVAIALAIWLAVTSAPVASGFLATRPFPRIPVMFATIIVAALLAGVSPIGARLAQLPLSALVGFQAFRFPLELILHAWVRQGTVPTTMTWTGSNLDIISGLTALVCAPLATRTVVAAWVADVVGIGLLVNLARVAVLSSPVPLAWGVEPPLQLILHMPYALIATVCVAGGVAGHVILTRRLLASSASRIATGAQPAAT